MSNEILQQQLRQALENKDTALVYDLYKQGANLKAFSIWGIIEPDDVWAEKREKEIASTMRANPRHYFLKMKNNDFGQDKGFTSQFAATSRYKPIVSTAKNKPIKQIIEDNDLTAFRGYLSQLTGPTGAYTLFNYLLPEVIRSRNTEMYKLTYSRVTNNASLDNSLHAAWEIKDSKIFSDLLKKITDHKTFEYYLERMLKLDTQKKIKQLECDITNKRYLTYEDESLNIQQEMFAQFLRRASKETKQGVLLSHYIKTNNKILFETLLPQVTDQKALGKALKSAVELKKHESIDTLLPKITDQQQLGEVLIFSLRNDRASIFDKILSNTTDKSELNKAMKCAKTMEKFTRGEEALEKVNARITEIETMSIDNEPRPATKVRGNHR